jgi:hypothetical protein
MNDSFAAVTWRTGLQPLSGWPLRPLCSAVGVLEQVVPQLQELVSRLPPTFFQPLVSLQGLQVRHVQYRTEQHSTVQYVTVQGVPQQAVHSRAAVKVSTCSTPPPVQCSTSWYKEGRSRLSGCLLPIWIIVSLSSPSECGSPVHTITVRSKPVSWSYLVSCTVGTTTMVRLPPGAQGQAGLCLCVLLFVLMCVVVCTARPECAAS